MLLLIKIVIILDIHYVSADDPVILDYFPYSNSTKKLNSEHLLKANLCKILSVV